MSNVIRMSISESGVTSIFKRLVAEFGQLDESNEALINGCTVGFELSLYLEDGKISLQSDGNVKIRELDVVWDRLRFYLRFKLQIMDFIRDVYPGQRIPRLVDLPDTIRLRTNIRLDGLRSELSFGASPLLKHESVGGNSYAWRLYLKPWKIVDVDPVDMADTVDYLIAEIVKGLQDQLEAEFLRDIENGIDRALSSVPGWAMVDQLFKPKEILRWILDIPDDIGEKLAEILDVNLSLVNILTSRFVRSFAEDKYLYEIENPYPVLPSDPDNDLPPVFIDIVDLETKINDNVIVLASEV